MRRVAEGEQAVFEVKYIGVILVVNLIAVTKKLLKRHRIKGHRVEQVEIGGGGWYSAIQASHEISWGGIWTYIEDMCEEEERELKCKVIREKKRIVTKRNGAAFDGLLESVTAVLKICAEAS